MIQNLASRIGNVDVVTMSLPLGRHSPRCHFTICKDRFSIRDGTAEPLALRFLDLGDSGEALRHPNGREMIVHYIRTHFLTVEGRTTATIVTGKIRCVVHNLNRCPIRVDDDMLKQHIRKEIMDIHSRGGKPLIDATVVFSN